MREWRLRADGAVKKPVEFSYEDLQRLPSKELNRDAGMCW
jgi:DMSO/TMAO reductase YedYZ molybdopterin-dependent catalytic subunit